VVTDSQRPVKLRIDHANGLAFSYTPISDAGNGRPVTYGPISGTIEIAPAAGFGLPVVTANGRVVKGKPGSLGWQPVLSRMRVAPTSLRLGGAGRQRLVLTYADTLGARTTITLSRGRGTVGKLTHADHAGVNRVVINSRLLARLAPGNYVITAVAKTSSGRRSAPVRTRLRIGA